MSLRPALLLLLAALVACGPTEPPDADGDGLSDEDEDKVGTDPDNPDSDGDGLTDGDEVWEHETNPLDADTDGDGYDDALEISEGLDPTDDESAFYEGGWPFNPNKDDIDGADPDDVVDQGDVIANLRGIDQFGDEFQLYDLLGHGRPVILDVSAEWCPPCRATSSWLAGINDQVGLNSEYPGFLDKIESGDIYWVTFMDQNNSGSQPTEQTSEDWDEDFPNENVPVAASEVTNLAISHMGQNGFPNLHCIGSDGTVEYMNERNSQFLDFNALGCAMDLAP